MKRSVLNLTESFLSIWLTSLGKFKMKLWIPKWSELSRLAGQVGLYITTPFFYISRRKLKFYMLMWVLVKGSTSFAWLNHQNAVTTNLVTVCQLWLPPFDSYYYTYCIDKSVTKRSCSFMRVKSLKYGLKCLIQ